MKIGFNNACLPSWDVDRTFEWARTNGWPVIELHGGARYRLIDWREIARGGQNPIAEVQERTGVRVCGIMHGLLPFLSPDPGARARAVEELEVLLRAAARSDIGLVSTFTGRDPAKTLEENLELMASVFDPVLELAYDLGVRIAFENCPMYEQWPHAANIAVAPVMWRQIFERLPAAHLGLNLDPSHLVWQGIDIARAIGEFGGRLFLVQAKDTEVLTKVLRDEGMLTLRWWRHRLPGHGEIDWTAVFSALTEVRYPGPMVVEHEDPLWLPEESKVLAGLDLARRFLRATWDEGD